MRIILAITPGNVWFNIRLRKKNTHMILTIYLTFVTVWKQLDVTRKIKWSEVS